MELKGKTVLITGGKRVGQFVAREVAKAGMNVVMTYLETPGEVNSVLDDVAREQGVTTASYQIDLADTKGVARLMGALRNDHRVLDALVNMASIFVPDPKVLTRQDIERAFAVNAFGSMELSRAFAEMARERKAPSAPIVSFIDWAVDHPYTNYDLYVASKAALRHYLMGLQTSFAGIVRVVNIHPGMILEPPDFPANEKQTIIANTPTQAIGEPAQAASLVRTALELDYWVDNVYLAGGQQWRHRLRQTT